MLYKVMKGADAWEYEGKGHYNCKATRLHTFDDFEGGKLTMGLTHFFPKKGDQPGGLPYEYVKSKGAFKVMALHDSLTGKLSEYRDYVIAQIKADPDTVFNINNCSKKQLLELFKCVNLGSGRQSRNLYEVLAYDIEELRYIEEAAEPVVVARYNPKAKSVLGVGDKWENERSFSSISKVSGSFIEIVEKESTDEAYLAQKEQYEKDMAFYNEHQNMVDHEPVKPLYQGSRVAVITEAGRGFLEWASDVDF